MSFEIILFKQDPIGSSKLDEKKSRQESVELKLGSESQNSPVFELFVHLLSFQYSDDC